MTNFNNTLHYKCNIFASLFKLSIRDGYDSRLFIKEIMTAPYFDWLFITDDCQDWCDEYFMMSKIKKQLKCPKGQILDEYLMWFTGYLYKYWMSTKGLDRVEVYRIMPVKKLINGFEFYHTQGWEYIINEATKEYVRNKKK